MLAKHLLPMNSNKAITYSLLAYLHSDQGRTSLAKGPLEIFVPLIKRALSKMNEAGVYEGKSLDPIKKYADELYQLDFPYPVLKTILKAIEKKVNEKGAHFKLYKDDSFQIKGYQFTEIEQAVQSHKNDVQLLEDYFQQFCATIEKKVVQSSIFDFIDYNRAGLSKYLADKKYVHKKDFTVQARFVEWFKTMPNLYEKIKSVYIGSIISSYIEYQTETIKADTELLLDTNFLVALLDLNSVEIHHTVRTLLKVCKNQGFTFKVLDKTIEETRRLLMGKARSFNRYFLLEQVQKHDIYHACIRRKLNRADLERMADNLEQRLAEHYISIVYDSSKYENKARFSEDFAKLKDIRNSELAALHDATALHYVRDKRGGKPVYIFNKAKCWFVNISINRDDTGNWSRRNKSKSKLPEKIKADDLLNILWLSNPGVGKMVGKTDVADIGLASLISITLSENLPKQSVIRELDDNIQKYATEDISDTDVVRLSTRVANRELEDLEELNELAQRADKEPFVKRLREEAAKQKAQDQKLEAMRQHGLERIAQKEKQLEADLQKIATERAVYADAVATKEAEIQQKAAAIQQLQKDQTQSSQDIEQLKAQLSAQQQAAAQKEANQEKARAARNEQIEAKNKRTRQKHLAAYQEKALRQWRQQPLYPIGGIVVLYAVIFLGFMGYNGQTITEATKAIANFKDQNFFLQGVHVLAAIILTVLVGLLINRFYTKKSDFPVPKVVEQEIEDQLLPLE